MNTHTHSSGNSSMKPGQQYRVFDYGNDIINEIVTVTMVDPIDDEVIYETDDGEKWVFSGIGYFSVV